MGKAPSFQFYPSDWLSDPQLRQASSMARGVWIDCLCFMWEAPERGTLTGTPESLSRMLGITEQEIALFIAEIELFKFASVTVHNRKVTLENRRMVRDEKARKNNTNRQARFRNNAKDNGKVTSPSSSSVSSPSKQKDIYAHFFNEQFWPVYPKKQAKKKALKAWLKLEPDDALTERIVADVKDRTPSEQWTKDNGQYIPLPATYLNGERWTDEDVATPNPMEF